MNKCNIILNITTSCNYNCSYCDVIKNNKKSSKINLDHILLFIKNNKNYINNFKFFWWEPLLAFDNIKYIIDNSKEYIWNNYEIVTNTSLLNNDIWDYFNKYFKIIFFSIDTENNFDYEKVTSFIKKYKLEKKLYFNLVINPWQEEKSLEQFKKLYSLGFRKFNILPVYFTKPWFKKNLKNLSKVMKYILDLSIKDINIKLYWFQNKESEKSKLINNSIFIDVDWKVYYSDIVSNNFWKKIKEDLFLWNIDWYIFNNKYEEKYIYIINELKKDIENKIIWQKELHKIMDYFSKYLNKNNAK
jgi:sulfatase maturation enzyme AslB (radical SAM superfamily)